MSGHSKWANIKHRKAAGDAKKGKIFTKHAKWVALAARSGGDPVMNHALRAAIDNARAENMPRENIERAIKKGTGELKGEAVIEEVFYEGFGPGGTAIYIQTMTDNKNRTFGNLKVMMNKNDGRMGEAGSVGWMFKKLGLILVVVGTLGRAEEVELSAIDAGAADVKVADDVDENGEVKNNKIVEVYTDPTELFKVKAALESGGVVTKSAVITYVPSVEVEMREGSEEFHQLMKLLEIIENDEDVGEIYSNAKII